MAIATCENCQKRWVLRKEPGEYKTASGLPDCSDCGSTKVELVGQPTEPADVPQPARETEDELPAQANQMRGMMSDVGAQMATPPSTPEESVEKKADLVDAAAGLATGYLKQGLRNRLEGIGRSKQRSDEIEPVEEYSTCGACNGPIKNLPPEGTEFDCPHCDTPLRA